MVTHFYTLFFIFTLLSLILSQKPVTRMLLTSLLHSSLKRACCGFEQCPFRITSCHVDKMALPFLPTDIICRASLSTHTSHDTACLGYPASLSKNPLPWLQYSCLSQVSSALLPGFFGPTRDQRICSHFPTNIPPYPEPWIVCLHITIILCHFILLSWSRFSMCNMPPKAEGGWSGWAMELPWWKEYCFCACGCRMFKDLLFLLSRETCTATRGPGIVKKDQSIWK